jgi:hypothetical protein
VTTYYVDGAVGNDGNLGTSEGAGNAWATIQQALDTVAAADIVYVKASATYNEALTTSTAGTAGSPIVFEGYTTTPGDEGIATNDGTTGSLAEGWTPISGNNYYVWKNFRFTNFTGTAFGNLLADHVYLYRIEADNSGSGGIELDDSCEIVGCHAHDNTGDGMAVGSFGTFYRCISHNNTGDGFEATAGMAVIDCLSYENTGNGLNWAGANAYGIFTGNTIVASSASAQTGMALGISNTANRFICCNNTVSGYSGIGGKGIDTAAIGQRALIFNNNLYDNETNYDNEGDLGGGTTGDPDFVNAASDDYTPDTTSPLIAAGFDVSDVPNAATQTSQTATVGALLRATVSASGGAGVANKRAGKQ